jgi:hypothetical protein
LDFDGSDVAGRCAGVRAGQAAFVGGDPGCAVGLAGRGGDGVEEGAAGQRESGGCGSAVVAERGEHRVACLWRSPVPARLQELSSE